MRFSMWRSKTALAALGGAIGLLCGGCPLTGGDQSGEKTLDQAALDVTIWQAAAGEDASVTATIGDSRDAPLSFTGGQAIRINGVPLAETDQAGDYEAELPAAETYTFRVEEATADVAAPPAFTIQSPAEGAEASLSGFQLTWSDVSGAALVRVTLRQRLFNTDRVSVFGPFEDAGLLGLSAEDLNRFQQGADLQITVEKFIEVDGLTGVRQASVTAGLARSRSVTPGP